MLDIKRTGRVGIARNVFYEITSKSLIIINDANDTIKVTNLLELDDIKHRKCTLEMDTCNGLSHAPNEGSRSDFDIISATNDGKQSVFIMHTGHVIYYKTFEPGTEFSIDDIENLPNTFFEQDGKKHDYTGVVFINKNEYIKLINNSTESVFHAIALDDFKPEYLGRLTQCKAAGIVNGIGVVLTAPVNERCYNIGEKRPLSLTIDLYTDSDGELLRVLNPTSSSGGIECVDEVTGEEIKIRSTRQGKMSNR
jgi:hypothetical protein